MVFIDKKTVPQTLEVLSKKKVVFEIKILQKLKEYQTSFLVI